MSEITYIGERTPWGEPQLFGVERVDRRQHLYTVGKTGLGKTTLLRNLLLQDIHNGEGLTVIDPHLKWQLRSKLKELHQRIKTTMIYVTHDQTEALTFADQVVVMHEGEVVQIGTPVELFERPRHTFVSGAL